MNTLDAIKSERRAITFGDIVATHSIAMGAAVIAGKLESPEHGLQWIVNTLEGPGLLPDLDEARALGGAQAWFDAKIAEHEAFRAAHPAPKDEDAVPPADLLRGLDTDTRVRFYEHDFYVLSNFSAFNLKAKGNTFPTSEHAYHWLKFPMGARDEGGRYIRDMILDAPSAHEAFKIAERNRLHRRGDWDEAKVDIMRDLLRLKAAQHEYVRRKLLATGDRELVEDSWRDDFWGWGPNRDGQNMLGKLWMEVRAELRASQ